MQEKAPLHRLHLSDTDAPSILNSRFFRVSIARLKPCLAKYDVHFANDCQNYIKKDNKESYAFGHGYLLSDELLPWQSQEPAAVSPPNCTNKLPPNVVTPYSKQSKMAMIIRQYSGFQRGVIKPLGDILWLRLLLCAGQQLFYSVKIARH